MTSKALHKLSISLFIIIVIGITMGCATVSQVPTAPVTASSTPTEEFIPTATLKPTEKTTETLEPISDTTLLPTPSISLNDPGAISLTTECRRVVDGLYNLKKDLGLPDHYTTENPVKQDGEFDPNQYFQVLNHLSIAPGYTLDFVYFSDHLGGKPLVYARETSQASFETYEEVLAFWGGEVYSENSYSPLYHSYDYLEFVEVDDSPESYLEQIFLAFQGDQFYLWWHALYHDAMILCEPGDLNYIDRAFDDWSDMGIEFPGEIAQKAEQIDYTPTIVLTDDTVTLRLVSFSKWGGFFEVIYTLERGNPENILDAQFNPLIEYDCQIAF